MVNKIKNLHDSPTNHYADDVKGMSFRYKTNRISQKGSYRYRYGKAANVNI